MSEKDTATRSLYDLYIELGVSVDMLDPKAGFAVVNLNDVGFELPYKSPPFRPNYFSFLFVKKGSGQYTIDNQTFLTEPGSIYFTNPSNYRTFEWNTIDEIYLICFDETFLKENVHQNVFNEFSFLLTETVQPKILNAVFYQQIEQLYLQIHKEYLNNSRYKYKIIGSLFVVLLIKIKEYFWEDYNPIYEGNRSSQIVKDFKRTLEQHYRDLSSGKTQTVFRVQDYANVQNLHPNYLSTVIKSKTGKPIATWIADKTISEAKSLLQNSTISIKEIAFLLGFSEAAHFSNYFKKHTNSSPVLYRKEQTTR
ncbi:AraC family transcriptional regulator [Flavobacterium pectinovorum]|uniref:AraC family transcriptional regulator n=1 Tax=Flavobacterium pectinovorum TaxID=29533 RepID=A0AB36P048_9FLAO|nr:AraC family transcriptional regulator [Flavobacterium pectinovorum]OXB03767.1 AraC family transcriptional regulator [Flavobacterium pectinovorum]SHL66904.1 transcriptional regulator, AraC family [Flavobacterium pectinovorum]